MGRQYQISVRRTNGLEIWFVSAREIYVKDKYGWRVFTRWDVRQRGFWTKNWDPFRRALKDQRYLDMLHITRLATLHEISIRYARGLPKWVDPEKARQIREEGRRRNNVRFTDTSSRFRY